MIAILVYLLIMALFLFLLGLALDMVLAQTGGPPQLKPLIIGIVALCCIVYLLTNRASLPSFGF